MQQEDYFYDSLRTKWNDGIEVAKSLINDASVEYISFDIFDTLITRPLYKPQHVFELMDREFKELVHTNVSFAKVRMDGESSGQKKVWNIRARLSGYNLDEIYDAIEMIYSFGKNDC